MSWRNETLKLTIMQRAAVSSILFMALFLWGSWILDSQANALYVLSELYWDLAIDNPNFADF